MIARKAVVLAEVFAAALAGADGGSIQALTAPRGRAFAASVCLWRHVCATSDEELRGETVRRRYS